MKRIFFWFTILIIAAFISACGSVTIDLGGGASSQQSTLQAVIDSPANGSQLALGAVEISYHASAKDGVAALELSVDGQVLSNVVTPES